MDVDLVASLVRIAWYWCVVEQVGADAPVNPYQCHYRQQECGHEHVEGVRLSLRVSETFSTVIVDPIPVLELDRISEDPCRQGDDDASQPD